MLFCQGLFIHRQLVAVEEVCEAVLVHDVLAAQGIPLDLKITAEITCMDAIESLSISAEATQRPFRILQLIGGKIADDIHQTQLILDRKLVQFRHALVAEGYLVH